MRITRSILLFIALFGSGHAAAVVSANWQPERLVLVFEPQQEHVDAPSSGLYDYSWQKSLSAEQLRAARRALMNKKKALMAKKRREMAEQQAEKALMDAQRERVHPASVQSVPEIDGQYAGLALALMLAFCLVIRERARHSS